MDIRSIKEAGFIARFIHIVMLGVIVGVGIHFGSRTLVAGLTIAWFVLFGVVYLFVKQPNRQRR